MGGVAKIGGIGAVKLLALICPAFLAFSCGSQRQPQADTASPADTSSWAVNPAAPGPDHPPEGRSLFDLVVGERVPFPFAALVQLIQRQGGVVERVLIPLGRSLQRSVAAPEFFRYPRAIVAVDGEEMQPRGKTGMFLKDRLFLGYQEKAGIIEVISYNEAAGRFEFEVVKDYRAGASPQVLYASRKVCTGCHQGQAPIFSRQSWDETSANPEIRALLGRQQRDFYDFPAGQGIDIPFAIENAAGRANLFSAYQILWQEATGRNEVESIRWRARVLTLLLQYRLTGGESFDTTSSAYRAEFLQPFAKYWQEKRPQGLLIPNPQIPNRNPLSAEATGFHEPGWHEDDAARPARLTRQQAAIPKELDPSTRRPPLEAWLGSRTEDLERVIRGLAGFLSESEILDLDRRLAQSARERNALRAEYRGTCRFEARRRGSEIDRLTARCGGPGQQIAVEGVFYLNRDHVSSGSISRLQVDGALEIPHVEVMAGEISSSGRNMAVLHLARMNSRLHARLPDGRAVERLTVSWDGASDRNPVPGEIALSVWDDFTPVQEAIRRLASETEAGKSDALSSKPFRRASLIPALHGL